MHKESYLIVLITCIGFHARLWDGSSFVIYRPLPSLRHCLISTAKLAIQDATLKKSVLSVTCFNLYVSTPLPEMSAAFGQVGYYVG